MQLLYSYLISESQFGIEQLQENPTREKRFAYQLYVQTLAMMAVVSRGLKRRDGSTPLASTRFISAISEDERVQAAIRREESNPQFCELVNIITEKIKESAIYKNFLKKEDEGQRVWAEIFRHIIIDDTRFNSIVAHSEGFTLHGVERMREMMEKTFANLYASSDSLSGATKQLDASLEMARELYMRLLELPVEITRLRELQIEENREKYLATAEDLNPNLKFVENKLASVLAADDLLNRYVDNRKCSWLPDNDGVLRHLLKAIMESETYLRYMESAEVSTLKEDAELWRNLFKQVIFRNDRLLEYLEDKSVFWNDDLDIMGEFMLKTLKRIGETPEQESGLKSAVMPMYKDEEDARFGRDLFTLVMRNRNLYRGLLEEALKGSEWDSERLAYMDVIIIYAALAEIMNYPKVPLKASISEFVEIAKYYSTPKSSGFVFALLTSITNKLRSEGKLAK